MSQEQPDTPEYIVTVPGEEDDEGQTSTEVDNLDQQLVAKTTKYISQSVRSQSLQSSSSKTRIGTQPLPSSSSSVISQQLKSQSTTSIVTEKCYQQKSFTSSTTSTIATTGKTKFQSFLQNPDDDLKHAGNFLTAHQKHVRQFTRSTSAHSETSGSSSSTKPNIMAVRSASHADDTEPILEVTGKAFTQQTAILISKSAEAFETKTSQSTSGIRTQLTLSGGLLAPPNRRLTILSPVHAQPGLQDMLKRHGRSPLSPRISFPGSDTDLFA